MPSNQPQYNVLTYGADPTGANDSTPAIQDALDAAAATKSTAYVPAGVFLVGNPAGGGPVGLNVPSDVRVLLEGTLRAAPIFWNDKGVLTVHSRARVVIEGPGTIDGQEPVNPAGRLYGVDIRGSSDVTVRGITLLNLPSNGGAGANPYGNAGDGILVLNAGAVPSTDVLIEGVTIDGATRNCISIVSGQRVSVRRSLLRNVVNKNPGAGVDVEMDASIPEPSDITISDCDFEDLAGAGVLIVKGASRVQVLKNRFRRCRSSVTNQAEDVLIAFNDISEFIGAAVFVYGNARRTRVASNTIRGEYGVGERAAVTAYDTEDLQVVGNVISRTYGAAMFINQRNTTADDPAIARTAWLTITGNQMIDCIAVDQRLNVDGVITALANAANGITRHVVQVRVRDNSIHDSRVPGQNARHGVFANLVDPADATTWNVATNTITGVVTPVAGVPAALNTIGVAATLAPGAIAAGAELDVPVGVPGLGFDETGGSADSVLATPSGPIGGGIDWRIFPSAANTLTVRFRNHGSAPATPTARTWSVTLFQR